MVTLNAGGINNVIYESEKIPAIMYNYMIMRIKKSGKN